MSARALVAGIGNVFLSDDAFGVEVAARLATRTLPPSVRVEDYGIRGIHLAYELLDGYDVLVLVDAVPMGEAPGTMALIEPQLDRANGPNGPNGPNGSTIADAPPVDAHTMSPDVVLAMLARLGGEVGRVVIVGCQPADLREGMGLSPAVEDALDRAVDLCLEVVTEIANAEPAERGIHR